jgi:hypothetical protein
MGCAALSFATTASRVFAACRDRFGNPERVSHSAAWYKQPCSARAMTKVLCRKRPSHLGRIESCLWSRLKCQDRKSQIPAAISCMKLANRKSQTRSELSLNSYRRKRPFDSVECSTWINSAAFSYCRSLQCSFPSCAPADRLLQPRRTVVHLFHSFPQFVWFNIHLNQRNSVTTF